MVNKRLVLVVENLNMMFADMMDRDAGWRLRKTLQTEPRIVLLGSATSRFDEMDHRDEALYDLFHVHWLRPLNTDECAALWRSVSGREPESAKIRALEILTGGSPRLLAIVAQFGASFSFRELLNDLLGLVDEHTEYFKSHIEALPSQERRVYLAIAEAWAPSTTREISDRARLDTNKCSAWLKRLTERGVVGVVGGTTRRKLYYLTERMYNIYYLLRHKGEPSGVVHALVRFMVSFYSPSELRGIRNRVAKEANESGGLLASYCRMCLQQLDADGLGEAQSKLLEPLVQRVPPAAGDEPAELLQWLATYDAILDSADHPQLPAAGDAMIRFYRATALGALKRTDDALSAYAEIANRFANDRSLAVQALVARALMNRSLLLGRLERPQDQLDTCEDILVRFGKAQSSELREGVARALCLKGETLRRLGRQGDAVETYGELTSRVGKTDTPALRTIAADGLLCGASIELRGGRPGAAVEAATRAVDLSEGLPAIRVLAHAYRAAAALDTGDEFTAERDVVEMVEALPVEDPVPHLCLEVLVEFYRRLGPQRLLDLIQPAPSRELLYPLLIALQRKLGQEPVVSPELDEVARDVQARLDQPSTSE